MPRSTGGDALSRAMRELRGAAGLRQIDAAERAGVSQPLIARFEIGRQVPRPDQVERLCDVYGAHGDARRVAVGMARDARASTERVVMHRDVAPAQSRINRIAETVTLERTFSPSGIPGLLQTADYARALFLAEPNLTQDAAEGALGWSLLPRPAMAEQLEHLIQFTDRPNIKLGIIPWGYTASALPLNSFAMFDDRLVIVGTNTRVAYRSGLWCRSGGLSAPGRER